MEKFKGTKSEFDYKRNSAYYEVCKSWNDDRKYVRLSLFIHKEDEEGNIESDNLCEENEENAKLVTDAFNTMNKCDLFPSELLEQRDELLEALISCKNSMSSHPDFEPNSEFEDFVNKAEKVIEKVLKQKQ